MTGGFIPSGCGTLTELVLDNIVSDIFMPAFNDNGSPALVVSNATGQNIYFEC